jgi:rubrerythrin
MSPIHPDTLAALTSGIQSEVASYVFYVEASKHAFAAEYKDMLQKLALEEKDHFRILERQYDSLVRSEKWNTTADILKEEGLPEIDESMTRRHQDLIDEVAAAKDMREILTIALRLETEARELFSAAQEKVDSPEGKKMFERLAKFEEGHERTIQRWMEKYS